MRFKTERRPDKYNEFLMIFLKYPYKSLLKTYELHDKNKKLNENFILSSNDRLYKCQRYCPHAFGDLSRGQVIDGKIICPLHNWKYSLKDGNCLNNNSKIKINKIEENDYVV